MESDELQLTTCWGIALMDATSRTARIRGVKDPNRVVAHWWDPYQEGSNIVLRVLREHAKVPRKDPGYSLLADYVDLIREEFKEIDPLRVMLLESDDYQVNLLVDGGKAIEIRILNPVRETLARSSKQSG